MKLSKHTVNSLKKAVTPPNITQVPSCGIIHLGVGAFHRAHQAVYTDDVLNTHGGNWGICGVSLRRPNVRDTLAPQDYLYSVISQSEQGEEIKCIRALQTILVAPEDPTAVVKAMNADSCKIVSLTITEKGYYYDPASHALLLDHDDIQFDLQHLNTPKTALGFIVAALQQRMQQEQPSFTVLSCDNLPSNGKLLKNLVLSFAKQVNGALSTWIEKNTRFPCTMIDRIVPATSEQDIKNSTDKLGVTDHAAIMTEPFSQWIIEDSFCNDRPAWESSGAQLVKDVTPFEEMKLRMLNGCHSTLAYLGFLAGYDYIYQVMENSSFITLIDKMMSEQIIPTLTPPEKTDLMTYKEQLITRFKNPCILHKTYQIAMDGSQKLPQRLLNTIRDRIHAQQPYHYLALAVAAWIRYCTGVDETGKTYIIQDPLAQQFTVLTQHKSNSEELVNNFIQLKSVFTEDLASNAGFKHALNYFLKKLLMQGAKETVSKI